MRERIIVITRLVPRDQFRPAYDGLFALAEKWAIKIVIATERVQLLIRPTRCSPDQAVVLYSILTFIERRDFNHRKRTRLGVQLAAETILLQHRL